MNSYHICCRNEVGATKNWKGMSYGEQGFAFQTPAKEIVQAKSNGGQSLLLAFLSKNRQCSFLHVYSWIFIHFAYINLITSFKVIWSNDHQLFACCVIFHRFFSVVSTCTCIYFFFKIDFFNKTNSTNLYPPPKGFLRETCKSQNINPIYLTLSSP